MTIRMLRGRLRPTRTSASARPERDACWDDGERQLQRHPEPRRDGRQRLRQNRGVEKTVDERSH